MSPPFKTQDLFGSRCKTKIVAIPSAAYTETHKKTAQNNERMTQNGTKIKRILLYLLADGSKGEQAAAGVGVVL